MDETVFMLQVFMPLLITVITDSESVKKYRLKCRPSDSRVGLGQWPGTRWGEETQGTNPVTTTLSLSHLSLGHHCETRCSCKHTYYAFTCQSHSVMILLKFPSTAKPGYSEFQVTIEKTSL